MIAAGVALVAVLILTAYVGNRALTAKKALEEAQGQLTTLRSALGQPDQDLTASYTELQASTARAVEQTDDPVWSVYEHVWWVGPNLTAFRQTAEIVDNLVQDGLGPLTAAASGLSVDSLKPHDGRIDLRPLQKLAPATVEFDDAVQQANTRVEDIDTSRVVTELRGPIEELRGQLREVSPLTRQLRMVVPMLSPMLGGDGTRHYLLMFQNNAEERASGGNPASLAMLVIKNGKITLGRQASSADFPHPYRKPPYTPAGDGNQDWDTIFTDYASSYLTNITMTPDFPSTAKMARAMWRDAYRGPVEGVISFDPVALSYLLEATGPVKLTDGTTIDASNAVSFLLHDVYAKYADAATQDAVFASAARSIFAAIMTGKGDPRNYLDQLKPMIKEQRLKMWSARTDEQNMLMSSPMGTMLPADNDRATVLGVYNNDDATSKMSYFMDEKVAVTIDNCQPTPTYTVAATVINTLPSSQVSSLPEYVRAHQQRIPAGGDRQWVQIYGPVGARLKTVSIDGKPVVWGTSVDYRANTNEAATGVSSRRPAVKGTMYHRPVGVVSITLGPDSKKTVRAVFTGSPEDSTTVQVSHTPKVRDVPVTMAANCQNDR
ncbi:MAG: DUF4012 domain-containing protein [Microlunatus sp.]|nr:DUF4012 domain-containing protein [Microlunatus sp.]